MSDAATTALRARFAIPPGEAYLVNHSLGAMPRAVNEGFATWAGLWAERGVSAWSDWLPYATATANTVGAIIGAPPGTVVMGANVSSLAASVASCLDFTTPRNRIVYSDLEFPSLHYLWQEYARLGAEPVVVRSGPDLVFPTEQLLAAIDERTLLVPLTHVVFRTAEIVDVAAVVARAHAVGAIVLLDSYQAAGAIPFDVTALAVDLCVGGSVKWLCGGPGAGWLYVRPDLAPRLEPVMAGWFSHANPFAFEVEGRIDYAAGAARFTGGTPSMPAIYAARAGYEIIREVGPEAIRERSRLLTARIVAASQEQELVVRSPLDPDRRGAHVTIDFEGAESAAAALVGRGFFVDYRPGSGIRIGPHAFNSDAECDAVMAEIRTIRRDATRAVSSAAS